MKFSKYHALGNDYIVIQPEEDEVPLTQDQIKLICHRNFGIGSDGILYGPLESKTTGLGLQIFNPDGSEAEKSGNGLRIFSRYLWDQGLVHEEPFQIETLGGIVQSQVHDCGKMVTVDMGKVSFDSTVIPVEGPARDVLEEDLEIAGKTLKINAATIGNPHCVIIQDVISKAETCELGPLLENHILFPNRTNVQFMKILDRNNIQIEIWERGAGYTLASGSSSSASAAVAHKLGHCDQDITVHMPGGELSITLNSNYEVRMKGPVTRIGQGTFSTELFSEPPELLDL